MPEQPTPGHQLAALASWLDQQADPVTAAEARVVETAGNVSTNDAVDLDLRRPAGETSGPRDWLDRHRLMALGAAAAVALLVLGALAFGGGGGEDESVDLVDASASEFTLIAQMQDTQFQNLVELDADGRRVRDVVASGPPAAALAVTSDGRMVVAGGLHGASIACPVEQMTTYISWYELDRSPIPPPAPGEMVVGESDPTNHPEIPLGGADIRPGGAFALHPDGSSITYFTTSGPSRSERAGDDGSHPQCAAGRALSTFTWEGSDEPDPIDLELVDWPEVEGLAWVDGQQLAVRVASETVVPTALDGVGSPSPDVSLVRVLDLVPMAASSPPAGSELSPSPLERDALVVTSADDAGMLIPRGGVLAAGGNGSLLLGGPLDDNPFDLDVELENGRVPYWGTSVWRGDPVTHEGSKLGEIRTTEFGFESPLSVPPEQPPLTVLSLAAAPDHSVYLTVAVTDALDFDEAGDPLGVNDPSQVALFRITPDGVTHKLSDGIVSVAVRPADDASTTGPTTIGPPTTGPGGNAVVVPEVVGLQADVARSRLEENGFVVTVLVESHPVAAVGEVVDQTPAGGRAVRYGSEIAMTVSAGQGSASVPEVRGFTGPEAKIVLESQGLVASFVPSGSADGRGQVLLTDPPVGTQVPLGETVRVWMSPGPGVIVPEVVGMPEEEAIAVVEAVGLTVAVEEFPVDAGDIGLVVSQIPDVGSQVDVGSTVTLRVGRSRAESGET